MACSRSDSAGRGGNLHHGAAELLLFHSAGRELEGPEEEDGPLPDIVEREKRLHASDKVCACQRKHLKVGRSVLELSLYFTAIFLMMK